MSLNPSSKSIFVPLIIIDNPKERLLFQAQLSPSLSTDEQLSKKQDNPGHNFKKSNLNNNNNQDTKVIVFNNETNEHAKPPLQKQCTCTKTKCLKKYCECYSNGVFCIGCNCKDCFNTPIYQMRTQSELLNQDMSCTCSKSNCNKKYCECYKNGNKCGDKCRCVNCFNKKSMNLFIMERTSVYIHNTQTIISNEKIDLNRNLGNKRWRDTKEIEN